MSLQHGPNRIGEIDPVADESETCEQYVSGECELNPDCDCQDFATPRCPAWPSVRSEIDELIRISHEKYKIRISRDRALILIADNQGRTPAQIAGEVWFAMEQPDEPDYDPFDVPPAIEPYKPS